jgi:hypothetical protein
MRARANGKPTTSIFAERDEQTHTFMKKAIVQIYSMSSLTSYEPLVDDTIRLFMDRLEQEFSRGADERKPCDMADWLQYYAFDVVLNLTFSNTLGFLEQGRDVDGFVNLLDVNMSTSALVLDHRFFARSIGLLHTDGLDALDDHLPFQSHHWLSCQREQCVS